MSYPVLLILHLLAAIAFIGTVFFEVVMIEGVRKRLPRNVMLEVERALGNRAVRIMPFVLLVLYGAGLGLVMRYHTMLARPFESTSALMLTIKVVLAFSVLGHFITAMAWRRKGKLRGRRSLILHISVFTHVILIVLLAKGMFYL